MMATDAARATPLYGGWAALYQRYRPRYPEQVFDLLSRIAPGSALCMELGAGSGQATGDLLERFASVRAVEPDREMAARLPPHARLVVEQARAEDAEGPVHGADAVVAATAYHWMDQDAVAKRAAHWLAPDGVFFVFGYAAAQYPGAPAAVTEVAMRYARKWRSHIHERLAQWRPYETALRESGAFASVAAFEFYADHVWAPAEIAGFLASTSYAQSFAQATGRMDDVQAALAGELAEASGGRSIAVRFPIEGAYGRVAGAS